MIGRSRKFNRPGGTALADQPMTQVDAWRIVRRRALTAGIMAPIGNHSFPRDRDHGVSSQWRHAGACAIDGGARKSAHHAKKRAHARRPGSGRTPAQKVTGGEPLR
jgi:hypothetical protein